MNSKTNLLQRAACLAILFTIISLACEFAQAQWWRRDRNNGSPTQVESVGAGGYQMTINPMFAPQPGEQFTPENVRKTISPEELQSLYDAKLPKPQPKEENKEDANNGEKKPNAAPEIERVVDPLLKVPQGSYKLGFPQAEEVVRTMESELSSEIIARQGVLQKYNTWINYLKARTFASARSTGMGGYNGICRLKWYEELLLDPVHSTSKTEAFSRRLHAGVLYGGTKGFGFMLKEAREKMGVPAGAVCETKRVKSSEEAYKLLAQRLGEVKGLHAQAVAPIKPEWLKSMNANLYNLFTIQVSVGHTVNYRSEMVRQSLINFEKIDYGAYYDAAGIMFSFSETDFLDQLLKLDDRTIDKLELVEKDADGNPLPAIRFLA